MGKGEAGIGFQVFFREGWAFVDRHFSLEMASRRVVVSATTCYQLLCVLRLLSELREEDP